MVITEILSPNCNLRTAPLNGKIYYSGRIKYIIPHCMVGQHKAANVANWPKFKAGGCASATYLIGCDSDIVRNVKETYRPWTTSSREIDFNAITIECASDASEPYTFYDNVYNTLVELCVDICKRYGIKRLLWLGSKAATDQYILASDEMAIYCHRWTAAVSCPGNWLYARLNKLADDVTAQLNDGEPENKKLYHVQIGAYRVKANAEKMANELKSKGYETYIVEY